MKLRELWGIPIPGTEKAVGLKKVTKDFMGKVRTYYEPVGNKINEKRWGCIYGGFWLPLERGLDKFSATKVYY